MVYPCFNYKGYLSSQIPPFDCYNMAWSGLGVWYPQHVWHCGWN